jgi:hypothetical protein
MGISEDWTGRVFNAEKPWGGLNSGVETEKSGVEGEFGLAEVVEAILRVNKRVVRKLRF